MEDLHEGANVLLAYWHYYRTDEDPLEVEAFDRHRSRLVDVGAEQFSFLRKSCNVMREKSESTPPCLRCIRRGRGGFYAPGDFVICLGEKGERETGINWRRGGIQTVP